MYKPVYVQTMIKTSSIQPTYKAGLDSFARVCICVRGEQGLLFKQWYQHFYWETPVYEYIIEVNF